MQPHKLTSFQSGVSLQVAAHVSLIPAGAESGDDPVPPDNETTAFVETYGVGVCRGRYAEALRLEWHAWDESHTSENEAVDCFDGEQLFVVFVVADGGSDLEHFSVRSFEEARSILLQVRTLSTHLNPRPFRKKWAKRLSE